MADDAGSRFPAGPLLRRIEELAPDGLAAERALQVAGARVALLDRALLQHDFPFLRAAALARRDPALRRLAPGGAARERAVEAHLARFLAERAGFVSRRQARQSEVNSPIATTGAEATAYRPPDYGRALVLPVSWNGRPAGLLDVKGAGVAPRRRPSLAPHASGLMFLGEALREAVYARLVDAALRHAGLRCRALPVYGVLDLGFDVYIPNGRALPAGLLVRRAHRRPSCRGGLKHPGSPLVPMELGLELALRRYGLTSAGPMTHVEIREAAAPRGRRGGIAVRWSGTPVRLRAAEEQAVVEAAGFRGGALRLEGTNVQLTREAETYRGRLPRPQILDFGAWRARARFEHPAASLVALRLLRLGEIIQPGDPRYVQPDPRLALPQGFLDEECFRLARRFRAREISARALALRLDAAIERATAAWHQKPGARVIPLR
jgi:hypothetical protein